MIRKLTTASLTTLALLSMAACTTTEGVKPAANIDTAFVKGVSTESDVDAQLGQPEKTVKNPDGTSSALYHYGQAHFGTLAVITTGTLGMTGQDIQTVVLFDRNGKFVGLKQQVTNKD